MTAEPLQDQSDLNQMHSDIEDFLAARSNTVECGMSTEYLQLLDGKIGVPEYAQRRLSATLAHRKAVLGAGRSAQITRAAMETERRQLEQAYVQARMAAQRADRRAEVMVQQRLSSSARRAWWPALVPLGLIVMVVSATAGDVSHRWQTVLAEITVLPLLWLLLPAHRLPSRLMNACAVGLCVGLASVCAVWAVHAAVKVSPMANDEGPNATPASIVRWKQLAARSTGQTVRLAKQADVRRKTAKAQTTRPADAAANVNMSAPGRTTRDLARVTAKPRSRSAPAPAEPATHANDGKAKSPTGGSTVADTREQQTQTSSASTSGGSAYVPSAVAEASTVGGTADQSTAAQAESTLDPDTGASTGTTSAVSPVGSGGATPAG